MRISLQFVSALAATAIILATSASVSAAPMRMAGFGGGHFAHFHTFGSHPNFGHHFAGDHFRHGHGRFFGGAVGVLETPVVGDPGASFEPQPGIISGGFSN